MKSKYSFFLFRGIWGVSRSGRLPWTWLERDSRGPGMHRQGRGHRPIPLHSLQYHMDPRLDRSDDARTRSWTPVEIRVKKWRGAPLQIKYVKHSVTTTSHFSFVLSRDFLHSLELNMSSSYVWLRFCKFGSLWWHIRRIFQPKYSFALQILKFVVYRNIVNR